MCGAEVRVVVSTATATRDDVVGGGSPRLPAYPAHAVVTLDDALRRLLPPARTTGERHGSGSHGVGYTRGWPDSLRRWCIRSCGDGSQTNVGGSTSPPSVLCCTCYTPAWVSCQRAMSHDASSVEESAGPWRTSIAGYGHGGEERQEQRDGEAFHGLSPKAFCCDSDNSVHFGRYRTGG